MLRGPKQKIPLESHGVYEIPCKDCEKSYVGQTSRRINVRVKEHSNNVRRRATTSALANHVVEFGHTIDFDNTRTLASLDYNLPRVFREAIEIEKRPNNINKRDDSIRLSQTWKPLLSKLRPKPYSQKSITRTNSKRLAITSSVPNINTGPLTRSKTK